MDIFPFPPLILRYYSFQRFETEAFFIEGREGVKWELGLACFCIGKMGFRSLGLGFESEKKPK